MAELEEKMKGVDTEMIGEKEELMQKEHQLVKEKLTTEGRLGELKVWISIIRPLHLQ